MTQRNAHVFGRLLAPILSTLLLALGLIPSTAFAGTTGAITGTVTDAGTGAPVANATVKAVSPSGTQTATTNQSGFYSLVSLIPDTYTVSVQGSGYEPATLPGLTVQQDLTAIQNFKIDKKLKEIGSVTSKAASNLVKPGQGTNVYVVTGQQLQAVAGADNLHKTLYEYIQGVPGVTANGYPAQPRIRGGQVTDLSYEFDGIPIQDRITGSFTTNLSNIGISNVEVFTGGLSAANASAGTGVLNSVVKTGTYPGFGTIATGMTTGARNNYLTLELGGASSNRKYSYYLSFDGVNSNNTYNYGANTFYSVLYSGIGNGPGTVFTRDLIGNFHYKPNNKNDVQFLIQNGNGEFNFNYLLARKPGEAPPLAYQPCAGNVKTPGSPTGWAGGKAPNGGACPAGLYFSSMTPGTGNIWHHYSGIGKLQWNHIINDSSFFALRISENFNQYIFDQPLADPNVPALESPGGAYALPGGAGYTTSCPAALPYVAGQPVPIWQKPKVGGGFTTGKCAWEPETFWGDRHSEMYVAALDYTNNMSARMTLKLGAGYEHDWNTFNYFSTNGFNASGTWPNNTINSIYPTTIPYAYAQADIRAGKWLFSPGVRWQQEHYGYPLAGGHTVSALSPTFNGTYTMSPSDVFRFSYGTTASFVGTGYIYRSGSIPGGLYDPTKPGYSFDPQRNISGDVMWEHQLDKNTSFKIGPWFNRASNYYELYSPVIGTNPDGTPKFGSATLSSAGSHNAFGLEAGLNHVDPRKFGVSYWLAGTYDNYWTTSGGRAFFLNFPLPANIVAQGTLVRDPTNPLISASLTGDIRLDRFHVMPFVYYQDLTFYNTGVTSTAGPNGTKIAPYLSQPALIAKPYWKTNLTMLTHLGPADSYTLGLRGTNIFSNDQLDTVPCKSSGTGCYPFNGPQSGVNTSGYIYQNVTQNPPTYELFFIKKW